MHLIPTQSETIELLRRTGALRSGHFEILNGLHTDTYLDIALAIRDYKNQKSLSVALSRRLREQPEIRAVIGELSIVAVTTGALPIAHGLCEALRARQVYWAEKEDLSQPMRFRQFLEQSPGEKVILVDDVLRAGRMVREARQLVESRGAQVLAVAVAVHQPTPQSVELTGVPLYYLARLEAGYYCDPAACPLCAAGVALERRETAVQVSA